MSTEKRIVYLFPGQGAQYVGMGRDFYEQFPQARAVFEEADRLLGRPLTQLIFDGPESLLTETKNSQVAIYVVSMAILRVLQNQLPSLAPVACAGLSLGEYSAITAAGRMTFEECLPLVQARGSFMNDACESTKGTMAAVIGLDNHEVEAIVRELDLPHDLWVANLNCPKQVVISGTEKGISAGSERLKERGAKRVIPLQVHGAFHSGLMQSAEERLAQKVSGVSLQDSDIGLVMNVTGKFVTDRAEIRRLMIEQVTRSVRWEEGIRCMQQAGVDLFIEIGCGTTLTGLNKRIGVTAPTLSLDKVADLEALRQYTQAT